MHKALFPILAALLAAACGDTPPPPEPIRPVKVVQVRLENATGQLTLAGEVRARHESPLAFRVGGKVIERAVDPGDRVQRDQVLARIEATDYELAVQAQAAEVAAAKADLAFAVAELERHRSLEDKGFISAALREQKAAQADAAQARLDAAESLLEELARRVDYTRLSADAEGVVTSVDLEVGQVVAPGQVVLVVARAGEREIEVHVPEAALARVQAATGFEVALNALPGQTFPGRLRELSAAADPATRTYATRISVAAPPGSLQLGMSATLTDVQQARQVLRLPFAAVVSRDGRPMVWKLNPADSTVHAVPVRVGAPDGDGLLIEAGIEPGDQVVAAGANLLREGQEVRALQ